MDSKIQSRSSHKQVFSKNVLHFMNISYEVLQ